MCSCQHHLYKKEHRTHQRHQSTKLELQTCVLATSCLMCAAMCSVLVSVLCSVSCSVLCSCVVSCAHVHCACVTHNGSYQHCKGNSWLHCCKSKRETLQTVQTRPASALCTLCKRVAAAYRASHNTCNKCIDIKSTHAATKWMQKQPCLTSVHR